jgi:hypothetical protein
MHGFTLRLRSQKSILPDFADCKPTARNYDPSRSEQLPASGLSRIAEVPQPFAKKSPTTAEPMAPTSAAMEVRQVPLGLLCHPAAPSLQPSLVCALH